MNTNETSLKKQRVGLVTSNKNDKTITVVVERKLRHPIYSKFVKRSTKFRAHDENNTCGIGDLVRIVESRPLSAQKRWRLVEIIEIPDHPFFIGVQYHPELKSTVENPQPIFVHFVKAAKDNADKKEGVKNPLLQSEMI